ncbi:MAG: hypothetical protein QF704_07665 [Anaerolineales bacterium]|jgi:hypothetical protein|nr:hypothetical protein [Anaerolineales bacterium]
MKKHTIHTKHLYPPGSVGAAGGTYWRAEIRKNGSYRGGGYFVSETKARDWANKTAPPCARWGNLNEQM